MKIFLRNKSKGSYYQGVDDWTTRLAEAFNFQWPERAARFVLAAGLNVNEMEVVFAFDDSRYNISVPVDERFGLECDRPERPALRKPILSWAAANIGEHKTLPASLAA